LIPIYAGFDPREEVGFHTFASSVIHHATEPVFVSPLHLDLFRKFYTIGQRDGTNSFIYTRFLIPHLQMYTGWAIFCDGADMVVKADIDELWDMRDQHKAVMVVKHDYKTKHPRKYKHTLMEADNYDYPCKNWSSVMLINCAHPDWRKVTPQTVGTWTGAELHQFLFLRPDDIGELPKEWNWLADEYGENPEAKLLHWTAGIPAWPAYTDAYHADDWRRANANASHATV